RLLFNSMTFPTEFGYLAGTLAEGADPLDALVLVAEPTFPGCRIRVRPIGVFHMSDEKGPDEKVLCVPLGDPSFERVRDVHDVNAELRDEIEHFFQRYKDLEPSKKTETRGWGNRAAAETIVADARGRRADRSQAAIASAPESRSSPSTHCTASRSCAGTLSAAGSKRRRSHAIPATQKRQSPSYSRGIREDVPVPEPIDLLHQGVERS